MTLIIDPLIPVSLLIVAVVLAVLFSAFSIWRNWRSGLLRMLAAAGLIALLANPLWRQAEKTPLADIAVVLVDESASQTLDSRDAVTAAARADVEAALGRLDNLEVRIADIAGADETRVIEALQTVLADTPRARLAGVVIVTDGQAVDAEFDPATLGLEAPVHLMLTGRADERDRKITLLNAPRYGIVRKSVQVSFKVDDLGLDEKSIGSGTAIVALRVNGEEVVRQPVPIGVEAGFEAPLPRPGQTIIELEVEPLAGELTERNNIAVLPITAIRDRLRVLLISGEPHPGERVWRNLLKSDPAVDLVHFTILRPIDKNDGTPIDELALIPFPQDELFIEKLSEFDLVIFDRYTYRGVISSFHFDNIARFVDSGGGVLIAAGPEYNGPQSLAARRNLSFILPAAPLGAAREGAFRPSVSDLGDRHPVTQDLPDSDFWGRWLRIMPVDIRSGQTLMTGPNDAPLVVLDRVGDGRVGLILSDHVWLWARGFDGGGPHAELLRRIAHWLMKEPELEEEALSITEDNGDLVIRRRSVSEDAPPVTVQGPDGVTQEVSLAPVEPGRFEARIENAPRGLYRATSGELFAIGAIGLAAAPEFQNVVATRNRLAPLAKETGGGVFRIRDGARADPPEFRRIRANASVRAAGGWAGLLRRDAARIDRVRDTAIASPWAWLVLIGLALALAWAIESARLPKLRRR